MTIRYLIKVKKSQSQEVLEKYPNLTSDVYIQIKSCESRKRLTDVSHEKGKKFIEKILSVGKMHINPNYPLKKTEYVKAHSKQGIDWEGEVELPSKAVKKSRELEKKQEITMT